MSQCRLCDIEPGTRQYELHGDLNFKLGMLGSPARRLAKLPVREIGLSLKRICLVHIRCFM